MPKDDYFMIVYIILEYLYTTTRNGDPVDETKIEYENKRFIIPYSYWEFIIKNMLKDGLIAGYRLLNTRDGDFLQRTSGIEITSKGIEYLIENSMMQKVKRALKDIKEIIPGA